MKLKSLLFLPLLLIGGLAGCADKEPEPPTDQEIVDRYANLGALIIDSAGDPLLPNHTYRTNYGDRFFGLGAQRIDKGKYVRIKWTDDQTDESKKIKTETDSDTGSTIITPAYVLNKEDVYDIKLKATLTFNEAIATREYTIKVGYATPVDMNLETIVGKFLNEPKEDSHDKLVLDTKSNPATTLYRFNAFITGVFNVNDAANGFENGIAVQDGEFATLLHKGELATLYNKETMKPGTEVTILGKAKSYYDLLEFSPVEMTVATESKATKPVDLVIDGEDDLAWYLGESDDATDDDWYAQDGAVRLQSRLVTVTGTVTDYLNASTSKSTSLKIKVGTKEVAVRVNKYLSAEEITAVNTKLAGSTDKTVTVKAVVNWYKGPQFALMALENLTPAECITFAN